MMSSDGYDDSSSRRFPIDERFADWLTSRPDDVATPDGSSKSCSSCGDPNGWNHLLLTIEWEEHLATSHGVEKPDDEVRVPLCNRCMSWAEMLEIAEMNLDTYGEVERRRIIEERNLFLDSLRVELVENFTVSTTLSLYE
ncbi:MAG: hypothetical protein V5A33_05930 [Halobacteriales archaeon]